MLQNDLFYDKKLGIIAGGNDRRIHNNDNEPFRTDDNLEDCEDKLECKSIQNTSIVPLVFILEFIFLRSWKN